MTLTFYLILAIVAALCLGGWLGWYLRGARIERRTFDAQIQAYERTIEKRHAPQHARTQPRDFPPTGPLPSHRGVSISTTTRTNADWGRIPPKRAVTRSYTDAAHIPFTVWAESGAKVPLRPQPPRTSGAGTRTLPRLTDTAELRLRAQAYIDKMAADDVEWRAKAGLLT